MTCAEIAKRRRVSVKALKLLLEAVVFAALIVLTLFPVLWGALTSFKSAREVIMYPPKIFNFQPVLDNYRLIIKGGFFAAVQNSLFYSFTTIIICLFTGMMAAYGLHRHKFALRKPLFYIILAGIPLSIGSASMLISNYVYFSRLHLANTRIGMILLYTGYNLPMTAWILRGGLEGIPYEIEEAATIDGCSRKYILFCLIPRLNVPALASAAIFVFIGVWNEFIVGSVMINSPELRPVQLAIYQFMGYFGLEWGPLTAAASASIVPILIVFTVLGRYLVSGLMQGSVKG